MQKYTDKLVNSTGTDEHVHCHQIVIDWDYLSAVTGPN
jgi:hypothetical protein